MKFTTHDNRTFRIGFRHTIGESADDQTPQTRDFGHVLEILEVAMDMRSFTLGGATECWITPLGEKRSDTAQGLALCSAKDTYDKEQGRRLALGRALQAMFPKEGDHWKANRLRAWDAYFSRGIESFDPSITDPQPQEPPDATV